MERGAVVKVLVVEAAGDVRKSIARCAASSGEASPVMVVATDDEEAMRALERHGASIDIVVYDADRPGARTLSMLGHLRGTTELSRIPCVLVTADRSGPDARCALRHGAAGLVGRPLGCGQLTSILRRVRSLGGRAASSAFKTESVTTMLRAISKIESERKVRPAAVVQRPAR
jgi:CheY-like chemotaxis protein